MTVSQGIATLLPGESASQLLERADQALYQAKESGRNQFCVAE
ncbi:MAG: diguanylate cyclase domain-containing protein [Aeromonas veronii]